jgi:hypothetical protein
MRVENGGAPVWRWSSASYEEDEEMARQLHQLDLFQQRQVSFARAEELFRAQVKGDRTAQAKVAPADLDGLEWAPTLAEWLEANRDVLAINGRDADDAQPTARPAATDPALVEVKQTVPASVRELEIF